MYHFNSESISSADKKITASIASVSIPEMYSFARLQYPDICIPNRGAAWTIYFKPEDSEEKTQLKRAVEDYNTYLDRLEAIDGFKLFFVSHNMCVSREEVAEHWSEETAAVVFSKGAYIFKTDLRIIGNYLLDASVPASYSAQIDEAKLLLPIGKDSGSYPSALGDKSVVWNWTDNGHDFCYFMWDLLGGPYQENEEAEDNEDAVKYSFDAYDQFRDDEPEIQLVRIFSKLENLGYLQTFTIIPDNKDPRWNHFCKSDGSLDCAIVDMSFQKNKLVMEQINQLLWTPADELRKKSYFLPTEADIKY